MEVITSKDKLIDDLLSYGEVEIAKCIMACNKKELKPISIRAGYYAAQSSPKFKTSIGSDLS